LTHGRRRRRVLVLGGTGMLGHKLCQRFRERFDTWTTIRSVPPGAAALFDDSRVFVGVDAIDVATIRAAVERATPDVIVNCIGLVNQLETAADPVSSISINALLPHQVAAVAARVGAHMIQISTDCVFAGTRGAYTETDRADADDLYGRTKRLGEIAGPRSLTVRTSIIGRELSSARGLVEWFLSHRGGSIEGFTDAFFSGVTTDALAGLLADVIERETELSGVYHVASARISKHDLLSHLNDALDAGVTIRPSHRVRLDRSLDGSRFLAATGLQVPPWTDMIARLAADPTPYEDWRRIRV